MKITRHELTYVMERLGTEATIEDALNVAELASALAAEQGDPDADVIDWLSNRTYPWTRLYDAAEGDGEALAEVRAEAHLPILS
jgi:hypothetical protein